MKYLYYMVQSSDPIRGTICLIELDYVLMKLLGFQEAQILVKEFDGIG